MPNNVPVSFLYLLCCLISKFQYAPPVSMIFFIGMAVTKVVNRATFIAVENGVFGLMTLAETKISMLLTERKPGVKTVRSTSSGSSAESVDSKEPRGFDGDSDSGSDDGVSQAEDQRTYYCIIWNYSHSEK